VGDGRFRNPLPHVAKDRKGKETMKSNAKNEAASGGDTFTMTCDSIPSTLHWSEEQRNQHAVDPVEQAEDKPVKEPHPLIGMEFWTQKETSCDIELDTTGKDIREPHEVCMDKNIYVASSSSFLDAQFQNY